MLERCRSDAAPTPAGREGLTRENAVALLGERDALIGRLRSELTKLRFARKTLRAEVARLRDLLLDLGVDPDRPCG